LEPHLPAYFLAEAKREPLPLFRRNDTQSSSSWQYEIDRFRERTHAFGDTW
jgi:hypothetical protein